MSIYFILLNNHRNSYHYFLQTFDKYLAAAIQENKHLLVDNPNNLKAYRNLQEVIFCSILIFNKRRVGELQRINLLSFLKNYQYQAPLSEFENVLTESEKILYKSLQRVVIRGKRGRGVPVLFTKEIIESLDFLINLRKNFKLEENPYLFGLPNSDNPIQGNMVMRKHARLAFGDGNKASLLTSTKIRKHLATIAQILKMDRNELEQLATFLGHTEKTHAEFYRLPDNIYQTAKVSKILLMSKSGEIEKYKGKTLKDIEIDEHLIEDTEDNNVNVRGYNIYEKEDETELMEDHLELFQPCPSTCTATTSSEIKTYIEKKKVIRERWTEEQKNIAKDYFKKQIATKTAVKQREADKFINEYPDIYRNKTWKMIKAYIQNIYDKKLKN